ncbi:MAG: hypothetical protein ACE5FU_04475 [Nitrospinota bacterium]
MNVLIVSGNSEMVVRLKNILSARLGIKEVTSFDSGAKALLSIKEKSYMDSAGVLFGKEPIKACEFKIVLFDEAVSDLSNLVFMQTIRKLFDRKTLPALLLTEGRNKEELMEVLKRGANSFVLKPVNGEILGNKIRELLGKESTGMVTSAAGVFKSSPVKKKPYRGSDTLRRMSSGAKGRGGGAPIGAYYSAGKKSKQTENEPVQIVDDGSLISGHYHEQVDVIGGGINCVWAKEVSGQDKVALEYVSAKGRPTGIHVKTILKNDFLKGYRLCTKEVCDILKRLEADKEPGS